jgi:hypothetical protein
LEERNESSISFEQDSIVQRAWIGCAYSASCLFYPQAQASGRVLDPLADHFFHLSDCFDLRRVSEKIFRIPWDFVPSGRIVRDNDHRDFSSHASLFDHHFGPEAQDQQAFNHKRPPRRKNQIA